MTVSKTKARLVDVARQLFAKMGVENTTMNDMPSLPKKVGELSIPISKARMRSIWQLSSLNWIYFRT